MSIGWSTEEVLITAATTAWSYTPATPLVTDEILFLAFSVNASSGSITGPTDGSVWNYPNTQTFVASGSAAMVWAWHRVTAGESGTTPTYDFTGASTTLTIHVTRLTGIDPASPINAFGQRTDADTTRTMPAITSTVDGCAIFAGTNIQSATSATVNVPASGWTDLQNSSGENAGRGHVLGVRTALQSVAGAVTTDNFSSTSSLGGIVWAIAVAPDPRTAPTHVATYAPASNYVTGLGTLAITVTAAVGDVLVVKASTESAIYGFSGVTDSAGNTYTLRQSPNAGGSSTVAPAYLWTTVVTSALSGGTVTVTATGGNAWRGATVHRYSNSDGIGASAATNNGTGSGTPSVAITTTDRHSTLEAITVDWNAVDGASRSWLTVNGVSATEITYLRDPSLGTAYGAYWPDTGPVGARTVGLSAPTGQRFAIAAVEILGKNGATSSGSTIHRWVGGTTRNRLRFGVKTSGATSVRVGVSTVSDLSSGVVYSTSATPSAEGWSKHEITGLTAGTTYYYAIERNGTFDTTSILSTETLPAGNSFVFAHASCLQNGSTTSAIFDRMTESTPDFFLQTGDWHYDDNTTATVASQEESIASQIAANNAFAAFIARFPTMYNTSDHDAGANNFSPGPQTHTPFLRTAYVNMVPSYDLADSAGLQQSFVVGRCRFIICDTRSYRSANSATDDSSKTMLGATQKAWLFSELLQPEQLKFIVFDCPWIGTAVAGDDDWTSFTNERTQIVNHINTNGVKAVIIHGDAHCLAADDGTNSPGGIPVIAAAPLSQTSSIKGGPYSQGTYPTSGSLGGTEHLAGIVTVTDTASSITVSFNGIDDTGTSRITLTEVFSLTGTLQASPTKLKYWNGSAWVTVNKFKYWNGSAWKLPKRKAYT